MGFLPAMQSLALLIDILRMHFLRKSLVVAYVLVLNVEVALLISLVLLKNFILDNIGMSFLSVDAG
jgi:hypothetical protein